MVEIAPITDEAIPAMNLMVGEVTLLYFAKAQDEESAVIGKLAGIHADLRGTEVKLSAQADKVHVFKDGISLLFRDEKVFLPGVQPH